MMRIKDKFADRAGGPWKPTEDALLGTGPDEEVARRLGRSKLAASRRRQALGLLERRVVHQWTEKETALLGTMMDKEIAALLGLDKKQVAWRRNHLKILGSLYPAALDCRRRRSFGHDVRRRCRQSNKSNASGGAMPAACVGRPTVGSKPQTVKKEGQAGYCFIGIKPPIRG